MTDTSGAMPELKPSDFEYRHPTPSQAFMSMEIMKNQFAAYYGVNDFGSTKTVEDMKENMRKLAQSLADKGFIVHAIEWPEPWHKRIINFIFRRKTMKLFRKKSPLVKVPRKTLQRTLETLRDLRMENMMLNSQVISQRTTINRMHKMPPRASDGKFVKKTVSHETGCNHLFASMHEGGEPFPETSPAHCIKCGFKP